MPRTQLVILALAVLAAAALAAPLSCRYRCGTAQAYADYEICRDCAESSEGCRVQLSGMCDQAVYDLADHDLGDLRGMVKFVGPATIVGRGSFAAVDDASFTDIVFDGHRRCHWPYRANAIAASIEYHNCTFRNWCGRDVISVEGYGDGTPSLVVNNVVFDSVDSTVVRAINLHRVDISVVSAMRCGSPCIQVKMDPRHYENLRVANVSYTMEPVVAVDLTYPSRREPDVRAIGGTGADVGIYLSNNDEADNQN